MSKIVAVVVIDPDQASGGAPIFIVKDKEEQKEVAFTLEKYWIRQRMI